MIDGDNGLLSEFVYGSGRCWCWWCSCRSVDEVVVGLVTTFASSGFCIASGHPDDNILDPCIQH